MKTSNKILTGFIIAILLLITALLIVIKINIKNELTLPRNTPETSKMVEHNEPFSKLEVKGPLKLYLTQSEHINIELKGAQAYLGKVEASISDNTLFLTYSGNADKKNPVKAYVSTGSVEEILISSGVELETTNQISGTNLRIECSAGSKGMADLNYKKLDVVSSTGSLLELKGIIEIAYLLGFYGSVIEAGDLKTRMMTIKSNNGSSTNVYVTEKLDADIGNGAELTFSGSPAIKNVKRAVGASVTEN